VQASELLRQQDTRAILESIVHASSPPNALLLTGVENSTSIPPIDSPESLPPPAFPISADDTSRQPAQPELVFNDAHEATSPHVLPALQEIQTRQNTHDAAKDLADLRRLLSASIQTTNDAQMLEVLQIGRDEMPEAMKTLQRALEKLLERDSPNSTQVMEPAVQEATDVQPATSARNTRPSFIARRMTLKSFKSKPAPAMKRSKTESSQDSDDTNDTSAGSTSNSRARDTLDREFIESGLDALRRMSKGLESTLPSWTITRRVPFAVRGLDAQSKC